MENKQLEFENLLMNKSEIKEKIRRMKMEIQELEECLDKYEERDNRYDDDS